MLSKRKKSIQTLLFLLETSSCFHQTSVMFSLFLGSSKPKFWHLKGWQHCQTHRGAEPLVRAECHLLPKNPHKTKQWQKCMNPAASVCCLHYIVSDRLFPFLAGQETDEKFQRIFKELSANSALSGVLGRNLKPSWQLVGDPSAPSQRWGTAAFPKSLVTQHWAPWAPGRSRRTGYIAWLFHPGLEGGGW